jgi:hypothetical protein
MTPGFPTDPRLANIDNELVEIVSQEYQRNIDLVAIHLRDARNILYSGRDLVDRSALGKAALILAAAALESNLVYLSGVAIRIAERNPDRLSPPQIRYLSGTERVIDDNGKIVQRLLRLSLRERLQIVPSLLARGIGRTFQLRRKSAPFKKLLRMIERRDAIIHPRWDKYLAQVGWWEAAEAIDAVELYLDSIAKTLHPYMVGYFYTLNTIPGNDHHEVAVGYRTHGKRGPERKIITMEEVGITEVLVSEWSDSLFLINLALGHGCEGDSGGSMFTRAALVSLYAMLDAQLSVVAQWRMHEKPDAFEESEILFLNEYAVGVGHDGEVWIGEDHQSFKRRIKATPVVLSRRIEGKEGSIDLGREWGRDLLEGQDLRNKVMHSAFGEPLPRVTKQELVRSAKAVFAYFEELTVKLPITFKHIDLLLKNTTELSATVSAQFASMPPDR